MCRFYVSGTLTLLLLWISGFQSIAQKDSIREQLKTVVSGSEKSDLYLRLSHLYQETNIDSAMHYANRAMNVALSEDDNKRIAKAYLLRGKIQIRRDSIFPARLDFFNALNSTYNCNCKEIEAEVLMYLGKSYFLHDNYYEATNFFMRSLEIAEKINDYYILSVLYNDIGSLMLVLENDEEAMDYFEKAMMANEKLEDEKSYAMALWNIGQVCIDREHFQKASESFEKSFVIYQDMKDKWGMARAKLGEGNVQFELKNYNAALELYLEASEIADRIDIGSQESGPVLKANIFNQLGEAYVKLGMYEKAIFALRRSSDLAEEYTMPGRKADAAREFSRIYEKLGSTSMALDYYQIYNQLSDSIINSSNVSKITKLELEYQFLKEQKEKEIELIQKEARYQRKVLYYRMLIVLAILVITALVVIFILYRKNHRNRLKKTELAKQNLEMEKTHLQNELDFKNRELATSVMYQLKKNNFIGNIISRLKEINLNLSSNHKKSLLNIVKELEASMSKETWEEFEYRFNAVHKDFYDKLIRDFPDLTPNEMKLCAFLKLNMTSKDISTITYTTPQSITVARHRLRTKLGLSRDDNLVTFISKY